MTTEVRFVCFSRCLECGRQTPHEVCRHTPHEPAWDSRREEYTDWSDRMWSKNFDADPEVCPPDCTGDEE